MQQKVVNMKRKYPVGSEHTLCPSCTLASIHPSFFALHVYHESVWLYLNDDGVHHVSNWMIMWLSVCSPASPSVCLHRGVPHACMRQSHGVHEQSAISCESTITITTSMRMVDCIRSMSTWSLSALLRVHSVVVIWSLLAGTTDGVGSRVLVLELFGSRYLWREWRDWELA